MKSPGSQLPSARYLQELNLLEQVHMALGTASKLEEFHLILCGILVDPNTFGFSRAFVMRYDERLRQYTGRVALGATSREEHARFRAEIMGETQRLQELIDAIQAESPEPRALQPFYDLRFHSLWIHLLQGSDESEGLNSGFREVVLSREELGPGHLLERAAAAARAQIYREGDCALEGIAEFVQLPCIAARVMTKRGMHGILIADKLHEDTPLDTEALYRCQWLVNHASVTLENVELVEELTATAKRLQEVDRLKSNFLSIVSHELRTPLTSIVGFAQLVGEEKVGPLNTSQRDLIKRVVQHSMHLQAMVNDLLEIAEVEAGNMLNLQVETVDPLSAALNVIPKAEMRRGSKAITIEPIIGMTGPVPMIWANRAALERVFFHLLDNAVKFIQHKGRVTIEFAERDGVLDIAIQDTGIGISAENLKRIFEHFYQVDFRLERAWGGMGIGLTVVKLLLDCMRGTIRVESTPGAGTRFTLSFPVARGDSVRVDA